VVCTAGSARDFFGTSHDRCGRLETLDDNRSLDGAVAAINYAPYSEYSIGRNDGALYPKPGGFFDIGHPGLQDQILPRGLINDPTEYENTASLSPECRCSQMNGQDSILDSLQSFEHDAAQVIGPYNPHGQGLTCDIMSVKGVGLPPERTSCVYDGCLKTFTRTSDLDRHVLNVHNRVGHHCQVPACSNNKGNGYCRPDKLKEHMWKKHRLVADLSYTKAMPLSYDLLE
jgi:hypothetical protein